jgi:spore coat polysaccharide biosynthesis protein SpsF
VKTLVVVQARVGSSRLPGKVLLSLAGKTLLARVVERIRAAQTPFDLVVATTVEPADDPIAGLCRRLDVRCFRGHPTDLLDRHYRAALAVGADHVVKIPSDCPLLDPGAVDRVLAAHAEDEPDYTSNLHPESWPDGNDVEAVTLPTLAMAWREAERRHEREHTTPFVWDRPERFRLANVAWDAGRDLSESVRLVVDYPEDYALVREIYEAFDGASTFSLADVLALLDSRPELANRNARWVEYRWWRGRAGDLRTMPRERRTGTA